MGERPCRAVVGRDQQQVQQRVNRQPFAAAQIRHRRGPHVHRIDNDLALEIELVLEEHDRSHHLRDAGNRTLLILVLREEDFLGDGVVDDGRLGANVGDHAAAAVHEPEQRRDRIGRSSSSARPPVESGGATAAGRPDPAALTPLATDR